MPPALTRAATVRGAAPSVPPSHSLHTRRAREKQTGPAERPGSTIRSGGRGSGRSPRAARAASRTAPAPAPPQPGSRSSKAVRAASRAAPTRLALRPGVAAASSGVRLRPCRSFTSSGSSQSRECQGTSFPTSTNSPATCPPTAPRAGSHAAPRAGRGAPLPVPERPFTANARRPARRRRHAPGRDRAARGADPPTAPPPGEGVA